MPRPHGLRILPPATAYPTCKARSDLPRPRCADNMPVDPWVMTFPSRGSSSGKSSRMNSSKGMLLRRLGRSRLGVSKPSVLLGVLGLRIAGPLRVLAWLACQGTHQNVEGVTGELSQLFSLFGAVQGDLVGNEFFDFRCQPVIRAASTDFDGLREFAVAH